MTEPFRKTTIRKTSKKKQLSLSIKILKVDTKRDLDKVKN